MTLTGDEALTPWPEKVGKNTLTGGLADTP
jgi:hypothetical protein